MCEECGLCGECGGSVECVRSLDCVGNVSAFNKKGKLLCQFTCKNFQNS